MTDLQWSEFEDYVNDRLKNEQKILFNEATWRDDFTYPWPDFKVLLSKWEEKQPQFVIRHDGMSPKGRVLVFSCFRR